MGPAHERLYGSADPLPERTALTAGPLAVTFENGDLRAMALDGVEIVNRIYGAVRSREWATVPGRLSELSIARDAGSFDIRYLSEHDDGDVAFAWRGHISGSAEGTVVFAFEGAAARACATNRIGLCVLHPLSAAGIPVRVETVLGTTRPATFPELVSIEQPIEQFTEIASLRWSQPPGIDVAVHFEGDVFETEDQRNWIDASYKTYSTPLSRPRPRMLAPGERVAQRVTVQVSRGSRAVRPRLAPRLPDCRPVAEPMSVGLVAGHVSRGSSRARPALPLSHLRVDLAPGTVWQAALARAVAEAADLGCAIELALTVSPAAVPFLQALAQALPGRPKVCRVLVTDNRQDTTTADALDLVHTHLVASRPDCGAVAAGSARDLYQLHLVPPPRTETVFWGMHPQAHATDLTSIAETPPAAGQQVQAMRVRRPEARVAISPLRFHPRGADVRARSLFGAAWTLSILAELSAAGCDSVTIGDSPYGEDGWPLPLYFVLADMLETAAAGDRVVRPQAGVTGLLRGHTLLLANTGRDAQNVDVSAELSPSAVRVLDVTTLADATRAPDAFRAAFRDWQGRSHVLLEPGAVARIDGERAR